MIAGSRLQTVQIPLALKSSCLCAPASLLGRARSSISRARIMNPAPVKNAPNENMNALVGSVIPVPVSASPAPNMIRPNAIRIPPTEKTHMLVRFTIPPVSDAALFFASACDMKITKGTAPGQYTAFRSQSHSFSIDVHGKKSPRRPKIDLRVMATEAHPTA